ncbi:MAG TPA: hypothetical protein EYQ59_05690 [Planctomycetes bacterium]|nr:hypothetical protein [Planctomycetota bacterium]
MSPLVGLMLVLLLLWSVLGGPPGGQSPRQESSGEPDSQVREIHTQAPSGEGGVFPETVLEAPEDAGGRWTEVNSRAIEALQAGRFEEAIELFEECHAAEPGEAIFAGNLAEALARMAREIYEATAELGLPIELLERALLLSPGRDDLRQLLARWKKLAAAEDGFWTDETAHFRLSYDGARVDILNNGHTILTTALEEAYAEFALWLNHDPVRVGNHKIRVVLYGRSEFAELTGVGHWASGVYDGVVRIPVVDFRRERESLVLVLRHELVHAFLRSAGGRALPAWLNEGLAQWCEHETPRSRSAAVARARKLLATQPLFPLEKLHGTLSAWTDPAEIARGYAQALAFVAYIDRWYGAGVLLRMIEGCRLGVASSETFAQRIGVNLDTVLQDFQAGL